MFKLTRHSLIFIRFSHNLPEVRVRFAPSPTGYLHLGGLRTALYNFLFAKCNAGKFILRLEDTDQTRVIQGAAEQIQNDLNWAGIYINEGPGIGGLHGPYIQSQRLNIYKEHIKVLLDNNKAYRCFCTSKRLELIRKEAIRARQIPKYDNRCKHLSEAEIAKKLKDNIPYCIRFKLIPGTHTFNDLVYGDISYDISLNEGDPIIFKSDGYPTYHFANVVDDHLMKVSHVLRGVEWQISTTKHFMMYKAFGWEPPVYGHLPLLMNSDGSKLSKRQGDIQILSYRNKGILPLALVNYIVSSGGGFAKDLEKGLKLEINTIEELANQFNIKQIKTSSGRLMPDKLNELNRIELQHLVANDQDLKMLVVQVQKLLQKTFPDRISDNTLITDDNYVESILKWGVSRIESIDDLVSEQLMFLWILPSNNLCSKDDAQRQIIIKLKENLEKEECLNKNDLSTFLRKFSEENEVAFKVLMSTIRSALSGLKQGPSVPEMIEILGKENSLLRLERYIKQNNV